MKFFKIVGSVFVTLFLFLLIFSSKIVYISDGINFKYILPIGAIGCFFLAYTSYFEDKDQGSISNKKNTYLTLFMGIILIFFTIFL